MAAAALMVGPAPRAAADCPNVQLIFARGTAEPPGLGAEGDALFAALRSRLGSRSVDAYPVNYPASYNFLTTADAANDARDHIAQMVDQCPSTKLVLGGFSQGAAAVSMLADVLPLGNTVGNFGSAPPLDPGLANKVAAVAVFGNPGNRFGTPLSTTGLFAGRAIDLCSPGDPICVVGGRDRDAHHDYDAPPYPGQAAGFIAGLV
nr:cutinase family protein [Mycobacterium sp. Marseille-P9652]